MAGRRTFTPEFKARVVLEVISGSKTAAEICREHRIKPQLLSEWKTTFLENAANTFQGDARLREAQALELEVAHLPWRAVPGKKASSILSSASNRSERGHEPGATLSSYRGLRVAGSASQFLLLSSQATG